MSETSKKFYLTTPIYYVNARPHIGHAYTTIVADVLARRHRLLGDDVFFLTGTDEHGQKIERSAAAAGIPPQQFADSVSAEFQTLWDRMGLTYNKFIRTTDPAHALGVQKLFSELYARGFIYLAKYTGAYCVSDEAFVDVPVGQPCPTCGTLTEQITEENFFFKLSAFQAPLINLIETGVLAVEPESRRNEVLSFLRGNVAQASAISPDTGIQPEAKYGTDPISTNETLSSRPEAEPKALSSRPEAEGRSGETPVFGDASAEGTSPNTRGLDNGGSPAAADARPQLAYSDLGTPYVPGALKDLSISRSSFTWGIPVPEPAASAATQKHVIYVWLDALANYMTALGYGATDEEAQRCFQHYWPADLHLVGKEIIRFHCIYWPAFLLAAGLPLPKAITAHGWLLFDNSKMSKSKGNIVRTETILQAFGTLCPPILKGTGFSPSVEHDRGEGASAPEGASGGVALGKGPVSTGPHDAPGFVKGTASAVPSDAANERALAPEVSPSGLANPRDLFASDVLRYFLLREIPFGQDGSFSFEALITRYNADLANGYGNLVSRVLKLIETSCGGVIPAREQGVPQLARDFFSAEPHSGFVLVSPAADRQFGGARGVVQGCLQSVAFTGFAENAFSLLLETVAWAIAATDGYLTNNAPWKTFKLEPEKHSAAFNVLHDAAESIRIITALLYPILPFATARVWAQLGLGDIEAAARNGELKNLEWGGLKPGTKLGPLAPIFPRADKGLAQIMTDIENSQLTPDNSKLESKPDRPEAPLKQAFTPATAAPVTSDPTHPAAPPAALDSLAEPSGTLPVAGSTAHTTGPDATPSQAHAPASGPFASAASQTPITAGPADASPQITIDDFAKVELRVAEIKVCERIPKADKLLRLEVDLGHETRQILSGIAEFYTPEDLTGRRIIVITNLAPRKMRGLDSHGMLLAASGPEGGKPILATVPEGVPLGSRLK